MIIPISQLTPVNNNYQYKKQIQPKHTTEARPSFGAKLPGADYWGARLFIFQMDKLKEETQKYPQDIEYRKQLMANAGLNPKNQHQLRAIIGPQEIKSIMRDFDDKPEVFSIGENWDNVRNHRMRANMHMHTRASDGALTVTELLDNAAEYARQAKLENPKLKTPFVVAITDHDTTEGVNEAIRVISEKPLKYKDLRVILGTEVTTFINVAPNLVDSPTNTHVLVYGIDPNEKYFKEFINSTKEKKLNLQEMMTNTANETYKKHFGKDKFYSVPEVKHQYRTVSKNIIGIYNGMETYFDTKLAVEEVIMKDRKIKNALQKHNVPTDTESFMENLSAFRQDLDRNVKIFPPEETLPEFISIATGMKEEEVAERLEKGFNKEPVKRFRQELKSNIQEYKITFNPKYHYMANFETLYDGLKGQKNVIAGIAHPIDTVKPLEKTEDKYAFLEDLYTKFKAGCKEKAKFTEAYYQSYKPGRKEFNELPQTQNFLKGICKKFKLLRTGSADTHGLNIFIR